MVTTWLIISLSIPRHSRRSSPLLCVFFNSLSGWWDGINNSQREWVNKRKMHELTTSVTPWETECVWNWSNKSWLNIRKTWTSNFRARANFHQQQFADGHASFSPPSSRSRLLLMNVKRWRIEQVPRLPREIPLLVITFRDRENMI